LHPENVLSLIDLTKEGILIDINDSQSENAEEPIDVTLDGILIDDKDVQPENAESPIDVMLDGRLIRKIEEQYLKYSNGIDENPSITLTVVIDLSYLKKVE